jgi:hypothetical protein
MHPPPHGKASGASARDEHAHARAAKDVSCPGGPQPTAILGGAALLPPGLVEL